MEAKKVNEYNTKELRSLCQRTAPNPARESKVGLFTRVFSIHLTRMFLHTNIHPNTITVLSVIVFFAGVGMFISSSMVDQLIGVFFVFLSIVVDGSDGEVARFRGQSGPVGGHYVEPVSHDIQYGWSYLIFGILLFLQGASVLFIAVGAIASISKLEFRLLEIRYWNLVHSKMSEDHREIKDIKATYSEKPLSVRLIHWTNRNLFSSAGVLPLLLVAALTGRLDLVLIFWALGYTLFWLALSLKQYLAVHKTFYAKN